MIRTFDDLRDLGLEGVELEGRQKAQRAQVEGHDRRDAILHPTGGGTTFSEAIPQRRRSRSASYLEERRRVQQSSVSSEADDEVHAVGDVIQIW